MTVRRLPAAFVLIVASACTGDAPGFAALTAAWNLAEGTGSTIGETAPTSEPTTEAAGSASEGSSEGSTADATTGTTGAEADPVDDAELLPPRILGVDVPAAVHLAGPVAVQVTAEHATAVRGTLDGVELEPFADQGGGVWLGVAPIFGAVDNGDHMVEVSATNGPLADAWPPVSFTVKTPAPGGQAWALVAPSGTTKRAAVTPEGDLLEVGAVDVDGVLQPSIRKRSAVNGSELWPEGTIVVDDREGSADAVAVAPDGRVWVALNVKGPNKAWQPRIVQLDAEGHATGVEVTTEPGATVRGVAADAEGVVAVGFQGSGLGDMDVVTWRFGHDGAAVFTAKSWDYLPALPGYVPHMFDDFAFDVVVSDGAAWVVGASTGYHEFNDPSTRGLLVRLDLVTGDALAPATVAAPVNAWKNSMFLAAGRHPDGVVVTGNEATADGKSQQITVQAFDPAGARTYYFGQWPAPIAYGTGVAVNAHGLVLAAGVVHDGDVLRGVLYGRGKPGANFDYLFPGVESSAAFGLALDAWDQVYVVGERMLGGVQQARAARLHQ